MPQYRLSMTFRDEAARSSNVNIYMISNDEADALANVGPLLTYVGILTGARLEKAEMALSLEGYLASARTAINLVGGARPLADHDVEKGARFIFQTADDNMRLTVPAIRGVYIDPDGGVDLTAEPVDDFVQEMIGGDPANEDGDDVIDLIKAYKAFRDRGQP